MGFTVRLILGTVLVLLCSWSIATAQLTRSIRQANNDNKTIDQLQKIETENVTQKSTVANLTEDSTKPKTESSEVNTSLDKENSVVGKLQKSESYKKAAELARSIDIDKYVSEEFHNKNNVYSVSTSPDTKKYLDPDFAYHGTTHKQDTQEFDYHSELTTPKTSLFDAKFKEAVDSVNQKLEHIDDSHEIPFQSESKEIINLEKLYEETLKNDTEADLNFTNYKNIISNDTESKKGLHKDLVVEGGTNLEFHSSFNHTTVIDDDNENNTIIKEPEEKKIETSTISNVILAKGDLDSAESSTSKNVLTTRKSITLTKPPSNINTSHISILSNNIETETVKAINPHHLKMQTTTEKYKGETESVSETLPQRTSIGVAKRPYFFNDVQTSEATVDTNHIHRKQEQMQQENQIVPIHVEPPPFMRNQTYDDMSSESPISRKKNQTLESSSEVETSAEISEESEVKEADNQTESPSAVEKSLEGVEPISESQTTESISKAGKAIKDEEIYPTETSTEAPSTETAKFETPKQETEPSSTESEVEPTIATKLPVVRISSPKPETATIIQTEKPTTRLLEIITTTLCTPKLETTSTKPESATTPLNESEVETVTSIVTETSISPWIISTTETAEVETKTISSSEYEIEPTTKKTETVTEDIQPETTTYASMYLSDGTTATENPTTVESTTSEPVKTTEAILSKTSESDLKNDTITTEDSVRTSKAMAHRDSTPSISATTTEETTVVETATTEQLVSTVPPTTEQFFEATYYETPRPKIEEPETTTNFVPRLLPEFKSINPTDPSIETENATENITITSDFYEHTDSPEDNSGTIAAITISSIGAVCLILLAGLLIIMRKRQKRFNYGQRCRPVSLDDYSMDNASVYNNSVRRKGMLRGSKRSYGNPAFEDPASISHPLNFPALGKFANNLEDIKAEFEEIPQITARTNELPEGCDTKNRYANVIPLPETRVFLSLIDGYPNSDYINANYVTGPKNTKGYYIACQAPMQNTVDDFWRMIWEQQSKVILMLTHLFENGVEKCVDYLPPSEVLDCHRLFGDFQVTLKKREVKDKYIISSLQLKNMVSNSWREVTHFWYLGWPEKGVPSEANSLIAFLIEARSYMKSSSLDRKEVTNGNLTNGVARNELNPVVVHCSPGTGRTGVVIACDIAIREFEQTRLVDVPRIVYKIRRDRASAVQTKDQYAFIYKVVNLYATKLTGGALDSL